MKTFTWQFALALICFVVAPLAAMADEQLPLILKEDFESGFTRWQTSDPKGTDITWKIIDIGAKGNHAFRTTGKSTYKPKYRSPINIALLKDIQVTDFDLTVRVLNTNKKAKGHRDLCIFWGYQDPDHFYYVHMGSKPDPHACQIFIVNNAERTMITVDQAEGTHWDDEWHDVKVTRRVDTGAMEVYFNDMKKPYMTAKDKTFMWGQVGLGTFDDHGNFDDFELRGNLKKTK
jgi:hypothetical protein